MDGRNSDWFLCESVRNTKSVMRNANVLVHSKKFRLWFSLIYLFYSAYIILMSMNSGEINPCRWPKDNN